MITSDAHEGLKAALAACFPGVPWQRCQFHLQQNAQTYVPKTEIKAEEAAPIRRVFDAQDRPEAQNPRMRALPERSIATEAGDSDSNGTVRRMGDRQSLSQKRFTLTLTYKQPPKPKTRQAQEILITFTEKSCAASKVISHYLKTSILELF
ncbi:MAG: hypothetical protein ACI8XO_002412 [Verrucomicrobiales bacterium]|jgi:hypothetical protein